MLTYERYAEFRDAKGYKDHDIAYLTGIPKSTFSGWKSERYQPKMANLLKIAKILKIPPNEIVSKADIKDAELPMDG